MGWPGCRRHGAAGARLWLAPTDLPYHAGVVPEPDAFPAWRADERNRCIPPPSRRLRRDVPEGPLVGQAARGLPRPFHLHRLLDLGRDPGRALPLRRLPVADVLARAVGRVGARPLRRAPVVVAQLAALLARLPDPVGPGRLPLHLLLL